jgi:hypothetical protein
MDPQFDGSPMATLICPRCHRVITLPASSGARLTCSHCQSPVDIASEKAARWFVSQQNQKSGPYSWRTLLALASRGDLDPDAMLIKEHSERWLRAGTLRALFASEPAAKTADVAAPTAVLPQEPQPTQSNPKSAAAAPPPAPPPGPPEAQNLQGLRAHLDALDATLTRLVTPANGPASLEAAAVADFRRGGTIDAPTETADRLAARLEFAEPRVPAPKPPEPQPAPTAGGHRGIWDTPWLKEGLAAATISLLLCAGIVLGYYVFG